MKLFAAALLALAVGGAGLLPPAAQADGLPVVGIDAGPTGVVEPIDGERYVALPARGDTLVARIARAGGQVLDSRLLRGRFTIPVVAYDGAAGGLSADRRTLVLVQPRRSFPRAETTFAVLDADRLKLRERITLEGDFSFDALSPSGSWLYLIEYTSARDATSYLVRVYDLRAGRLLRAPIVDPNEPAEDMRGYPITRETSPDGRWAYTLYDGTEHPFVHALDTTSRKARCIDLDELAGRMDLYDLRLGVGDGGGTLAVVADSEPVALVDTRTFRVREPAETEEGPSAAPRPAAQAEDGGLPWPLVAAPGVGVLLAAAAALVALRRRASPAAPGGT